MQGDASLLSKVARRFKPKIFGSNATSAARRAIWRTPSARRDRDNLPSCRGRHPHMDQFDAGCNEAGESGSSGRDEQLVSDHALCIGHSARPRSDLATRTGRLGLFRRPGIRGRSCGHGENTEKDRCPGRHRQTLAQGDLGGHPIDQDRHSDDGRYRGRHQRARSGMY